MTISRYRWEKAQQVETLYWKRVGQGPVEFLRILHEKEHHLELIRSVVPEVLLPPEGRKGRVIEIGIGALGIGVASLLEPPESWEIVGVDPQPERLPELPPLYQRLHEELRARLSSYVQCAAERLPDDDASCDLAFCYNVLDHTQDWRKVLSEIYRVLRPGGHLVLGLDALSLAKKLQWNTHYRWFRQETPLVRAHPHRFSAWQVESSLREAGFSVIYMQTDRFEIRKRLLGRARRLAAVGTRRFGEIAARARDCDRDAAL